MSKTDRANFIYLFIYLLKYLVIHLLIYLLIYLFIYLFEKLLLWGKCLKLLPKQGFFDFCQKIHASFFHPKMVPK